LYPNLEPEQKDRTGVVGSSAGSEPQPELQAQPEAQAEAHGKGEMKPPEASEQQMEAQIGPEGEDLEHPTEEEEEEEEDDEDEDEEDKVDSPELTQTSAHPTTEVTPDSATPKSIPGISGRSSRKLLNREKRRNQHLSQQMKKKSSASQKRAQKSR
jgi:hypothetical protein